MSKYHTPPRIICDLIFGRLHSFTSDKALLGELEKKIEYITTNPPYGNDKERD